MPRLLEWRGLLQKVSLSSKGKHCSSSPSVPYIGPYLSKLVSIEVGMSTFVKNPPEHVNFSKLTKLAKVIEEVVRFQSPAYSFLPDGSTCSKIGFLMVLFDHHKLPSLWLHSTLTNMLRDKIIFIEKELVELKFDEDQRYSRSMELEPRGTQIPKSVSTKLTSVTD